MQFISLVPQPTCRWAGNQTYKFLDPLAYKDFDLSTFDGLRPTCWESNHLVLTNTNIPNSRQHGASHLQWISNGLQPGEYSTSIQFVQTQPSAGSMGDLLQIMRWQDIEQTSGCPEQQQGRWYMGLPSTRLTLGRQDFSVFPPIDFLTQ